jgi:LiaI-LiaF-like transmembrane region
MRGRPGMIWIGLGLIGLGIVFVLAQGMGWDKIWPVFPVLGGLAFWAAYAGTGFKDGGLAFVGTLAVLVGLFFFGFTFGLWEWAEMAQLWPGFLIIAGVAFIVLFLAEPPHEVGLLGFGLAVILAGAGGLAFTLGLVGADILKWWPLLLVVVGLISLVGTVVRMVRRE